MRNEGQPKDVMPQIIILIDELAELMMTASGIVQDAISRLAMKGRSAGVHLIVATQQPHASILTNIIKTVIPSRIAFAVSSNSASRVILDRPGAERLHGMGDMLFLAGGESEPIRVQCAYASEVERKNVIEYIKKPMKPDYCAEAVSQIDTIAIAPSENLTEQDDELFNEAVEMIAQSGTEPKQVSVSMLQRHFRIGYNRAARLLDMMEERGIVSASGGTNKPRQVIISEEQLAKILMQAEL